MYKFGFDETAAGAPEWYAEVNRQLEKDSFDEAARIAKDNVKRCHESGDQRGELQATLAYIKALLAVNDSWNAKRFADQALDLCNAVKDKALEGAAMHMMTKVVLKDSSERRISAALNNEAVTYSELCARQGEDYKDLVSKKTVKANLKDTWKAMPLASVTLAQQASQFFADAGNELGVLSVKITEAGIALKAKNYAEAGRIAEEAVAKAKDLGSIHGEAAAHYAGYERGAKDDSLSDAVQALDSIVSCLSNISEDNAKPHAQAPGMGAALLLSADLQRRQGDLQDAVTRAADAAQQFHNAGDGNNKGKAVLSMANAFFACEQLDDTIEAAEAAVQLFKASRNKAGQAQALAMIAECLARQKKKPEAVYRLEEAAFLYRQLKDKKNEAISLNSLSKVQVSMIESGGKVAASEPLRHAKRAAALFEESWSDSTLECGEANYTVIKLMYNEKEELEEAVKFGDKSRTVFEKLGNKMGEAAACAMLAQIYFEEKDADQGQQMAQKALELSQDTGDSDMIALANDLVTNQGKKKEAPSIELSDMDIIFYKVRICAFVEFESRRAKYKDVGGEKKEEQAADSGVNKPQEQKVQYVIRWQRVNNLNLAAVPIAAN